ncbi:ParM/StbA family protein [Clostridium septicum]|uniref:ParM/StbA family protein n=1 Tax=Clostridium septicum TaxID=1504 RepID=UPI00159ED2CC|nr:ParM/StbA family protein [Clostridium septicum]
MNKNEVVKKENNLPILNELENDIQIIGADLGRGFTKGYSEYNNIEKQCCFKSIVGIGRSIDFKEYEHPIYIEVKNEDFFVGELAEKEADTATSNSRDSKVTKTAQKLLYALLNEVAVADKVKIMLGVPNKMFKRSELQNVIETYKGKDITIKDKINGGYKKINIVDISIFREADAALLYHVRDRKDNSRPIGMITIGFRTTEMSYFDKGLKFNDKKSKTIDPLGNRTALEYVQRVLMQENISKELSEIDSSSDYTELKERAYSSLEERIEQDIESTWINLDEMDIAIAGGTALNMNFKEFKVIEDPQMATSKGLFLVATRVFK